MSKFFLLLLGLFFAISGLNAQPYTTSEYAVPSLSKGEIRAIIRDRARLAKEIEGLAATNARLNDYIADLKGRMRNIQRKSERTATDQLNLVRLNAKYVNLVTQLEQNVANLEVLLSAAEKKAGELEGEIEALREEIKTHQSALEELQEKLAHFKAKASALELALLGREAEITFLERSFSVASIDVFRLQRGKAISVDRNAYKRGLRRKDDIEIHLWAYTFDKDYIKKSKNQGGTLLLHLPNGMTKRLKATFLPARLINRQVKERPEVTDGISAGYGMLYRMQKEIDMSEYLDKGGLKKGRATSITYEVILPSGDRFFGKLNVRR